MGDVGSVRVAGRIGRAIRMENKPRISSGDRGELTRKRARIGTAMVPRGIFGARALVAAYVDLTPDRRMLKPTGHLRRQFGDCA
jgi:hypothetical protein